MAQLADSPKVSFPPNGAQFLHWLDGFVDEFNNVHDTGPKEHPLYCHWPRWWRNFKHECDDFNAAMFELLRLCESWELAPALTPAFRQKMDEGLALIESLEKQPADQAHWQEQRQRVADALDKDPQHPLAATRAVLKHQLWFRVAVMLDPTLPPPLPAWPQGLEDRLARDKANFRPSEYWGYDEFTDSTWACRSIPNALRELAWWARVK
jgi:hypothetical protein